MMKSIWLLCFIATFGVSPLLFADQDTHDESTKMPIRTVKELLGYQKQLQYYYYTDCHLKPRYSDETPLPIFSPNKWYQEQHIGRRYVSVPIYAEKEVSCPKNKVTCSVEKTGENEFTIHIYRDPEPADYPDEGGPDESK